MIARLHVPVTAPEDVVRHLGEQEKHWKSGRSAHALCVTWFEVGLPQSVRLLLDTAPDLQSAELVDAFLERQVDLGTRGRPSQTDLLAIVGLANRIAVMAVEGKAGEPFGKYVSEWLDGSPTKVERLQALCATLRISVEDAMPLRYQLLHRAASAIYEAKRYRTDVAILLVQSFQRDDASFADFTAFLSTLGVQKDPARGVLAGPFACDGVSLRAGWVDEAAPITGSGQAYLNDLRIYAQKLSDWSERVRRWCDTRE